MNPIKKAINKHTPSLYRLLASINFFLKCRKRLGSSQKLVHKTVFPEGNIKVLGGPFEGMAYYNKTIWGTITSKWLGCYEQEIQPAIEEIIRKKYPVIVDVGAAEGYYAVGLALMLPDSKVVSYDIDPIARIRQKQLAKLNNVHNLDIKKLCSYSELQELTARETVMICDIEGFEHELLDPAYAPRLSEIDILVEIHRFGERSVEEVLSTIMGRFEQSHNITTFVQRKRDMEPMREKVKALRDLNDFDCAFALDEGRYEGQKWLWMKAKNKGTQH